MSNSSTYFTAINEAGESRVASIASTAVRSQGQLYKGVSTAKDVVVTHFRLYSTAGENLKFHIWVGDNKIYEESYISPGTGRAWRDYKLTTPITILGGGSFMITVNAPFDDSGSGYTYYTSDPKGYTSEFVTLVGSYRVDGVDTYPTGKLGRYWAALNFKGYLTTAAHLLYDISDGVKIAIKFNQEIISGVEASISDFIISANEYNYVPRGDLRIVEYPLESAEKHPTEPNTLLLKMSLLSRFNNAVGNIRVTYTGSSLIGSVGRIRVFSRTFLPTDLVCKPDQRRVLDIGVTSHEVGGSRIEIDMLTNDASYHHVGLSSINAIGTLVSIDDI